VVILVLVKMFGWGGVYDKRFLRPSKQGLRARLNGFVLIWLVGVVWKNRRLLAARY